MSLRSWVSNSDDEVVLLSPSLFVEERVGIVAARRLTRPVAKDTIVLLLLMMFVIVDGCSASTALGNGSRRRPMQCHRRFLIFAFFPATWEGGLALFYLLIPSYVAF